MDRDSVTEDPAADCCSADTARSGCQTGADSISPCRESGKTSRSRKLIFTLVVIVAAGVGAYSLVTGIPSETPVPAGAWGALVGGEDNAAALGETPARSLCGSSLGARANLDGLPADKDVLFILLPGDEQDKAMAVYGRVESVVASLARWRRRAAALALEPASDVYGRLVQQLSVPSFPSVVVLGKRSAPAVLAGDITETQLVRAFMLASSPPSGCATPCNDKSGALQAPCVSQTTEVQACPPLAWWRRARS
jgi:hypothetical protein